MEQGTGVGLEQPAVGTMEDVGATYPVCDRCGAIGTSRTKDGDACRACQEASDA